MVFRISGIKGEGDKGSEILNPKSEMLNNVKEQSAVSNQHIKIPLNPPLEKGVQRPRKGDLTI